jgi:hypothetical protein
MAPLYINTSLGLEILKLLFFEHYEKFVSLERLLFSFT